MLVSLLSVDGEYFRHNRDNLSLPIHMQLSKKPVTFCAFLESNLNLEYFEKKMNLIA